MESFLFVLALGLAQLVEGEPTLQLASVIFRHGDRSPVRVFPADPNVESTWPQGFGQLSLTGMRQQFHLGELLRERYMAKNNFLFENYTRVQVSIRSTDYDRTLMSAESQLSALFFPDEEQQFNSSIPWQPVPVHTVPQEKDNLLRAYGVNCPRYSQLRKEDKNTQAYKDMAEENREFFEKLENYTGQVPVDLTNMWDIYDSLFVEHASGRLLPSWVTPEIMWRMKNISDYTLGLMFNTVEKNRLTAGLWIQKVFNDMQGKASGNETLSDSKLFLYSSHDTSVADMMSALRVYDGLQPEYASAFFIELLSEGTKYYVEMSYRNDTFSDEIKKLSIPFCDQRSRCTLTEFEKFARSVIPNNWEEECGLETSSIDKVVIALSAASAALVVTTVTLLVVVLWQLARRKRDQYTLVQNQETA